MNWYSECGWMHESHAGVIHSADRSLAAVRPGLTVATVSLVLPDNSMSR